MKQLWFILMVLFPATLFSQVQDTLGLNEASRINIWYLTSKSSVVVLEPKQELHLTRHVTVQLEKILSKDFLSEYEIGVIKTTPNIYLILECRKLVQKKAIKSRNKKHWGGGGLKGGDKYEHWTITIDVDKGRVVSKRKRKYRVLAKF
jgi:hypothetical protein